MLWCCNDGNYSDFDLLATPTSYTSHPEVLASDHKPVSASFTTRRFSPKLSLARSLPAFDPIVVFDRPQDWEVGKVFSLTYKVNFGQMVSISTWDWIGLYKVG